MKINNFRGELTDVSAKKEALDVVQGMQRRSHVVVQGRFTEAVCADDVVSGQKFNKPFCQLPAPWVLSLLLKCISGLSSTTNVATGATPHLLTPVIAGAHAITVSCPGSEPVRLSASDLNMLLCQLHLHASCYQTLLSFRKLTTSASFFKIKQKIFWIL